MIIRHFNKRILGAKNIAGARLFTLAALVSLTALSLAGCGKADAQPQPDANIVVNEAPLYNPGDGVNDMADAYKGDLPSAGESVAETKSTDSAPEENTSPNTEAEPKEEDTSIAGRLGIKEDDTVLAYYDAVRTLAETGSWPGGSSVGEDLPTANISFSIADVDADGNNELILKCVTESSSSSLEAIYELKDGELEYEMSEFPGLEFYASGNVKANWAHNQGLNPDIWPYNIYIYNKSSNTYKYKGFVDSWDKRYHDTDYEGNDFPPECDIDGDGILYSIHYNEDYAYGYIHDGSDCERLNSEVFGDQKLELTFIDASELL